MLLMTIVSVNIFMWRAVTQPPENRTRGHSAVWQCAWLYAVVDVNVWKFFTRYQEYQQHGWMLSREVCMVFV